MKNENNIETLFELLNAFDENVEIPIVQRDYAQGRKGESATLVRQKLLADMKSAILGKTPPLDLNFVYGKTNGKKFIPVDGQQRLTTLFLLHLYALKDDDSQTELLNRFTYETRTSSRDFLIKLTQNRSEIFATELLPSEEIKDSEWFVSGWKNDPTIQSVFVMLDDIKEVFGVSVDNLSERLLDNNIKPLVFKFLDIKDLGMEDSLYIKLNARGKPLTLFEEFKAQLIGRLKELMPMDFVCDFEHRFDTLWADLFWSLGEIKFDKVYLSFFGVHLMNKGIISTDVKWSNAFDFNKIDKDTFMTVYYTLNYICENLKSKAHKFILEALVDRPIYPQRVLFHAVTTYLFNSKGISNGNMAQWLRIIKNLTLNSPIDSPDRFRAAISGINGLDKNWEDLLDHFAKNGNISGFLAAQVKEEQHKARIIKKDEEFKKAIYDAEKHLYFSGQIRSALYYAINDDVADINVFSSYWNKIANLFETTTSKYGQQQNHLLRRALLSFGDYTLAVESYKTLCVDDPKEGTSTPSLKRLFSIKSDCVKHLLDTITEDNDVSEQLKDIIKNSDIPQTDWRYCFVKYPILFRYMQSSCFRLRNIGGNKLILVPKQKSTGYNYDLYLSALYEALKEHGINSWLEKGEMGTYRVRWIKIGELYIYYDKGVFLIKDEEDNPVFETKTDDLITEMVNYLAKYVSEK
jgi:hypothetical protein